METIYRYDGSFEGFLCCVFEKLCEQGAPRRLSDGGGSEPYPVSYPVVESNQTRARRILRSIQRRSGYALELVEKGFLTCAPERERMLYRFIRALYDFGPDLVRRLSDEAVHPLVKAVRHLDGEVHLLRGFTRFLGLGGTLVGEIAPKNRVLPLLRPTSAIGSTTSA